MNIIRKTWGQFLNKSTLWLTLSVCNPTQQKLILPYVLLKSVVSSLISQRETLIKTTILSAKAIHFHSQALTVNWGDFPSLQQGRISIWLPQLSMQCSTQPRQSRWGGAWLPSDLHPPSSLQLRYEQEDERRKYDWGSIIVIFLHHSLLQVIASPDRGSLGAATDCRV